MKNTITKGSKVLVLNDLNNSNTEIITNEDYCVVGKVLSYNSSTGAATFTKIWDEDETKTFYGVVKYAGNTGIPASDEIEEDSYLSFYRVGAYNSSGTTGFELNTESSSNFSWVAFIGKME